MMRTIEPTKREQAYVDGVIKARQRGRNDCKAGVRFSQNPYKRFEHSMSWSDGWRYEHALAVFAALKK